MSHTSLPSDREHQHPPQPNRPPPPEPTTSAAGRPRSMTTGRRPPRPLPTVPDPNSSNMLRKARSYATLVEEEPLAPISSAFYSPPTTSRASQRSLPPTPMTGDPSSPNPEANQEELRAAAATVQRIRQQRHHRQAPSIRIPSSPLGKASHAGGTEGHEAEGQWVQVLASPSGRSLPPLPAVYYDVPPPAYSEAVPYEEQGKPPHLGGT
jgi:hypothetical protein